MHTPLLLLGLVLTSCTTTTQGHAVPASPPTTTGRAVELPSHGAPKVANPLDVTRFEEDACLALTAAQAQELVIEYPGEPWKSQFGEACKWETPKGGGDVSLGFFSSVDTGLSAAYAENENGEFEFFEPLGEIEGFPAVAHGGRDIRSAGTCEVSVGVSDELSFIVTVNLSSGNVGTKDPCEAGATVAGMALRTMKGM